MFGSIYLNNGGLRPHRAQQAEEGQQRQREGHRLPVRLRSSALGDLGKDAALHIRAVEPDQVTHAKLAQGDGDHGAQDTGRRLQTARRQDHGQDHQEAVPGGTRPGPHRSGSRVGHDAGRGHRGQRGPMAPSPSTTRPATPTTGPWQRCRQQERRYWHQGR